MLLRKKMLFKKYSIEYILVFVCVLFLPLKPIFSNVPLIIFLVISFLNYYRRIPHIKFNAGLILFLSLFALYLVGLVFTPDIQNELKIIEKRLAFIFVPLAIKLLPEEKFKDVEKGFWEGLLILAFILGLYSFYSAIEMTNRLGSIPVNGPLANDLTLIHRPYFGLIQVLAFSYVLSLIIKYGFKINPILLTGAVISIASITLAVARITMAGLVIVCLYTFYKYLKRENILSIKMIIFTGLFVLVGILGVSQYDRFTERFKHVLQGKGEPRILIWRCVYGQTKIEEFNYLIGHTNSTSPQAKLIECYKQEFDNKTYWGWIYQYNYHFNTHNEYFSIFLSYGALGLLILLSLLYKLFIYSKRTNYLEGQLFIIVFAFSFITENMLARHFSIFIFTIGASIIIFHKQNKQATQNKLS